MILFLLKISRRGCFTQKALYQKEIISLTSISMDFFFHNQCETLFAFAIMKILTRDGLGCKINPISGFSKGVPMLVEDKFSKVMNVFFSSLSKLYSIKFREKKTWLHSMQEFLTILNH